MSPNNPSRLRITTRKSPLSACTTRIYTPNSISTRSSTSSTTTRILTSSASLFLSFALSGWLVLFVCSVTHRFGFRYLPSLSLCFFLLPLMLWGFLFFGCFGFVHQMAGGARTQEAIVEVPQAVSHMVPTASAAPGYHG